MKKLGSSLRLQPGTLPCHSLLPGGLRLVLFYFLSEQSLVMAWLGTEFLSSVPMYTWDSSHLICPFKNNLSMLRFPVD